MKFTSKEKIDKKIYVADGSSVAEEDAVKRGRRVSTEVSREKKLIIIIISRNISFSTENNQTSTLG